MVNDDAMLRHHLFEIAQTQGIGQVPANTLGNDIGGIVQALEGFRIRSMVRLHHKKQHVT